MIYWRSYSCWTYFREIFQINGGSYLTNRTTVFGIYSQCSPKCSGSLSELIRFHCCLGFYVCITIIIMFVNRWPNMIKTFVFNTIFLTNKKQNLVAKNKCIFIFLCLYFYIYISTKFPLKQTWLLMNTVAKMNSNTEHKMKLE